VLTARLIFAFDCHYLDVLIEVNRIVHFLTIYFDSSDSLVDVLQKDLLPFILVDALLLDNRVN
jgi:hypothetical protein